MFDTPPSATEFRPKYGFAGPAPTLKQLSARPAPSTLDEDAPLQIPGLFSDENCATPDAAVKALFGGGTSRALQPGEDLDLGGAFGYRIRLSGGARSLVPGPYGTEGEVVSGTFTQSDLDVFMGLLVLTQGQLGTLVPLEPYTFLKHLKRKTGGKDAKWLFDSLSRMLETRVAFRYREKGSGHTVDLVTRLINDIAYNHDTGRYSISVSPRIARLFAEANYTTLAFSDRLELASDLAKYLHAVFSVDVQGFRYHLTTLMAGYAYGGRTKDFERALAKAIPLVEAQTGWKVVLDEDRKGLRVQKTHKALPKK